VPSEPFVATLSTDARWTDEFDGPVGAAPDPRLWSPETGQTGWGNNELQDYTAGASFLDGDSHLVIEARRSVDEDGETRWTSGRLTTIGKFSFSTGTLTARIKLPDGQGLLPAFWLLGDSLVTDGWPASGEIDVVETPNTTGTSFHNIHGPNEEKPLENVTAPSERSHTTSLSAGFHDYSVARLDGRITISLDGVVVNEMTRLTAPASMKWVFDGPFHALFTLAVGGNWPGDPDTSTPGVSRMIVDWVRYDPAPDAVN
jgi:beta-glucanase (GH16 family)